MRYPMGGVAARPFASRFLLLLSRFDGSLSFLTLETESTMVTPGLPLVDDDDDDEDEEEEMSSRRHTASKQLPLPLVQFSIVFTIIIYLWECCFTAIGRELRYGREGE